MKRALACLTLAAAVGCSDKPKPQVAPQAAEPTTQADTLNQYEQLGTAPQADTGTAVGEVPLDSGRAPQVEAFAARPQRNKVPRADYTAGCTGLKCVYRSISKDPDGSIVSTIWTFPNGDAFNTLQVTRTYSVAGTYRITLSVKDNKGAVDDTIGTVKVTGTADTTILPPPPDTTPAPPPDTTQARGKPFGAYNLLDAPQLAPFNVVHTQSQARYVVNLIDDARNRKYKLILAIPGGNHNATGWKDGCCLRPINGVLQFSRKGYDSAMATYNTSAIKSAMQKAWSEGILLAVNVLDEPWVSGLGDGNTWGPVGTMTKVRVDSLCTVHRKVWGPGIPVGPSDSYQHWRDGSLKVCDVGIEQYVYQYGSLANWVANTQSIAKRDGYMKVYSFNAPNGGVQDRDGTWDCRGQGGIKGDRSPLCAMTATNITDVVKGLGDVGCGAMIFWRWDQVLNNRTDWKNAFNSAATLQRSRYAKPCKVRP